MAKQRRKQRKAEYVQIRVETLEAPKADSRWKVRAVNGLPMWTWGKNPMMCWKTPDHKSPLDQEMRAGCVKIGCTDCKGIKVQEFLCSGSISGGTQLELK